MNLRRKWGSKCQVGFPPTSPTRPTRDLDTDQDNWSSSSASHGSQDLWGEQNSKNWNWVFKIIIFISSFIKIFTKNRGLHTCYLAKYLLCKKEKIEEDPLMWPRTRATVHKLQHSNLDKWTSECAGLRKLMQDQRCKFTCVSQPRPPRKCQLLHQTNNPHTKQCQGWTLTLILYYVIYNNVDLSIVVISTGLLYCQ